MVSSLFCFVFLRFVNYIRVWEVVHCLSIFTAISAFSILTHIVSDLMLSRSNFRLRGPGEALVFLCTEGHVVYPAVSSYLFHLDATGSIAILYLRIIHIPYYRSISRINISM